MSDIDLTDEYGRPRLPRGKTVTELLEDFLALKNKVEAKDDEITRLVLENERLRKYWVGVKRASDHQLPYYAYGDNEAACEMSSRLSTIGSFADEALAEKSEEGKR